MVGKKYLIYLKDDDKRMLEEMAKVLYGGNRGAITNIVRNAIRFYYNEYYKNLLDNPKYRSMLKSCGMDLPSEGVDIM